jgi:hypothetical protein
MEATIMAPILNFYGTVPGTTKKPKEIWELAD